MAEVRAEFDALDRQIVALLADRLHYIDEAARIKQSRDQVRDEARMLSWKPRSSTSWKHSIASGTPPRLTQQPPGPLVQRS